MFLDYPDESFDSDMIEIFTKNEILSEEARSSTPYQLIVELI